MFERYSGRIILKLESRRDGAPLTGDPTLEENTGKCARRGLKESRDHRRVIPATVIENGGDPDEEGG